MYVISLRSMYTQKTISWHPLYMFLQLIWTGNLLLLDSEVCNINAQLCIHRSAERFNHEGLHASVATFCPLTCAQLYLLLKNVQSWSITRMKQLLICYSTSMYMHLVILCFVNSIILLQGKPTPQVASECTV